MIAWGRQAPDTVARPGEPLDWAACQFEDPDIFFDSTSEPLAKQVCGRCPARSACYEQVMARESGQDWQHRGGVVAGLTPTERATLDPLAPKVRPTPEPGRTGRATVLTPCPSVAAYKRHIKKREPIDDGCRAAWAAHVREQRHTEKARREGSPSTDRPLKPVNTVPGSCSSSWAADVFRRHARFAHGHMLWTGSVLKGVPVVSVEGTRRSAYRIAFAAGHGREPEGRVRRTCHQPGCVHPHHLADRAMRAHLSASYGRAEAA